MNFAVPADHGVKIRENEKRDKYADLSRELKKKLWNIKVTVIPIINGALGKILKGLVRGGRTETIVEVGQNTENSSGDLRIFAVIQIPVKGHQLTLVWNTRKEQ